MSLELATIRKDVPLEEAPSDLRIKPPDFEALETFCDTYELNSLFA